MIFMSAYEKVFYFADADRHSAAGRRLDRDSASWGGVLANNGRGAAGIAGSRSGRVTQVDR